MHYRLFVTTPQKDKTSLEARQGVYNYLINSGFIDQCNRFNSGGYGDWLVIGGRWSGALALKKGEDYTEEMKQRDSYIESGYEDDAQTLTEENYNQFLKEYEGKDEYGMVKEEYHVLWIDTEERDLSKELIDENYIVVVDYHS